MCDYAVKLTLAPGQMQRRDVQQLQQLGWTDDQVTIAAQVVGYFNYITRIAQGLGVEPESWMDVPQQQWLREKGRNYL